MAKLYGVELDRNGIRRHAGAADHFYGINLFEHLDGPERGVRVLQLRTGSGLEAHLYLDRAMDIGWLAFHGIPIGFRSPTGFRSPWLHESDAENGLGWLRSFTGLVNTCGLDHIMGPEEESAEHFNYPYRKRIAHGLHGRVAYIPARLAGYGVRWDGERGTIWAEAEIRQATMFGENLLLVRRIEAEVGGASIVMTDRVVNEGFYPTPHGMLYHVNVGWPVTADKARLIAPVKATPFTAHDPKATSIGPVEQTGPQSRFMEQVYEHDLATEGHVGFAAMANPDFALPGGARGIGCLVEWDARTMPAFYQWQNLQEGYYVNGLEPATAHAGSREDRKARGEIAMLRHGESRDYMLRLTPFAGAEAIKGLEARAARALKG
ncbi:MAG: DUF4432 family protein [Geminicoccaceae bacterium]